MSIINSIEQDLKKEKNINNKEISSINSLIQNKIVKSENLQELIFGIKLDTTLKHIKTKKELLNYCYLVAGTVGVMLCSIFRVSNRESYKFAVDLGIAMQLTNIARDILEDSRLGRVYFPKEWIDIEKKNIQFPNKSHKKRIANATKRILALSENYYKSSFKGLGFLPVRARFSILLALIIYREIGIKIKTNNYSNIYKREKVGLFRKIFCLLKCIVIFLTSSEIHKKCNKHNKSLHKDLNKKYAF